MKSTGVIIARFQTPYLHEGHYELISRVKEKHNKVVIVLGVSPVKGSLRNPLDFYTREKMVKKEFPDVVVLPLADTRNDERWSLNLDTLLSITFPSEKFLLYGSRDSFISYYSGRLETEEIPQKGALTATALREQISDCVRDSEDFRCGIIYAYANMYPKAYPTVDVALFRDNYSSILLGFREEEGKWRLPGGFTDPEDDDYESAALRELQEECGNLEVSDLKYEKSFKVNDWRYRKESDKIITLLFSCSYAYGNAKAGDDLDKVQWFSLEEVASMMEAGEVATEHFPQLNLLNSKYAKMTTLNT
ncbi:NUDIX domain-containing protein [Cytophagaceae bacterium ABcell3]|nr:NUDIX domain-containing protein [Cytophagaceae bacterium ABcell3]